MSTLWTPGGERPIRREPDPGSAGPPGSARTSAGPGIDREPTEAEMAQQMADLRDRLAATPAEVVVANHAYGLFELASLHLSLERPQLDQARVAIDALGYLVEGMGDRLGSPAEELRAGLAQLRMAFVQIHGAAQTSSQGKQGQSGGDAAGGDSGTEPRDSSS